MLSLEQISTLINGLKTWVLNEIKKSKADLGPLADEFVSFKEQVQDTIDNAALKPMVVMAKDGTLEANYNSSEIYNHVTSGGTAVFKFEAAILPLIAFDETFSTFLFTTNNGNSIGTVAFTVNEDGHIEVGEEVSNTVCIVNLSRDGTSASHGAEEIINMAYSGRLVLLEYNGDYYNLVEKSNADTAQAIVTFQKCFYYETEIRVVSIDIDYNAGANINTYDSVHIGVSSVNGQSGEVELTAEDVGALTEEDLSEMGFLTSEDAVADSPVPFDADTLNGHDSSYFAKQDEVGTAVLYTSQSLIDSEKTQARTNIGAASDVDLAVERARINQFVALEDGSTTGDAELQDIRVGYDGTVYETAGEAVRRQIKIVSEDLVNIYETLGYNKTETLNPADFEACYPINSNTGVREYDKWYTSVASNDAFFNYPYDVFIKHSGDVSYEFQSYVYDAYGNYVQTNYYDQNYDGRMIPANTNFRLKIRKDGVSTIDVEDVCRHLEMSYAVPGMKDDVEQLKTDVKELRDSSSAAADATARKTFDVADFEACYPINSNTGVREYNKWYTSVASNDAFFVADTDIELFSDVSENYQFVCVVYSKSGMFVKTYDYSDTTGKITLPAGTRYRLQIRKNGVNTIDVDDVCRHIYMSSAVESVCLSAKRLADYHNEDIVDFNTDILPAVYASSKYGIHGAGKENFRKKYSLLVTTDIHKSDLRLVAAIEYLNAIPSIDAGCCLGDIQGGDFSENDGTWYTNRVNCSDKPFYTVIGNHDCGNSTTANKCGTEAEVVAKFITQTEGKIGITGLTTPYYSFKNDAHKLYFIVLNNFDSPETLDDSGNYAFFRGGECFRQAQIDWFVSQLNAVPSDYSLVVLMHSFPYPNTPYECKFTQPNRMLNGNGRNAFNVEDNIIPSIVDAWKRGVSLYKTVNPVNEYVGAVDALTISADFASRGAGNFICYLVGHSHNDIVAHSTAYSNQLVIGFCSTALDNFQNGGSDLPRVVGTKSEDAITVVSFDTDNRNVNLVRVGGNITENMTLRDFESIHYTD